jgi:Arc/MetJ family transcription regulator
MRTNIDIDDGLMEGAMRAGHFKTKKDAVEAGLKLLSRQAAYHEILKWEGKLQWGGDDESTDFSADSSADSSAQFPVAPPATVVRTGGPAFVFVANESKARAPTKSVPTKKAGHGRR